MSAYVHGYSNPETKRLRDQSFILSDLLHHDTRYAPGERVLEAGCGVGAQTVHLLEGSPEISLTSLDLSLDSLRLAQVTLRDTKGPLPGFLQADLYRLPFGRGVFDHVFVCFVLEHLPDPVGALRQLKAVLKPGGTITVIEGDHGSCFFHPRSEEAWHVWNCLIEAQARLGGDSLIGRRLYPLLTEAGFADPRVSPRFVYADAGRPQWVEYFTVKTIIAMVEGVRERALAMGLSDPARWERGIQALWQAATPPDGVFCYTFFKGVAQNPA